MSAVPNPPTKATIPRKKACAPCSLAKVRCDQRRQYCTRCEKRGIIDECVYEEPAAQDADQRSTFDSRMSSSSVASGGTYPSSNGTVDTNVQAGHPSEQLGLFCDAAHSASPGSFPTSRLSSGSFSVLKTPSTLIGIPQDLVFTGLDLVCTIDSEEIRNRWLRLYVPTADQTQKVYPPYITAFISRILDAYSLSPVRSGTLPPFVHFCQQAMPLISTPLANCLNLARLCDRPLPGSQAVIVDTLKREMDRLYSEYMGYGELELLAAFQAFLIYAMLIYFNFDDTREGGLQQIMVNMQNIACEVSRRGLVSAAELNQSRPLWESWIVAEAKRRTLFVMYLFDSLLCARDGLPIFLGTELRGIPAPGSKELWQATDRRAWSLAYNTNLHQWGSDGQLQIDELWSAPLEFSEAQIENRRSRVDFWVSSLDEFGTMLFAVTSCIHGD